MADNFFSPVDLLNFNNSVQATNPYGIAGSSLNSWQPNMSTWSPAESGITSFGKAFLAGLLGNISKQDAASQLAKVVSVLPQLGSDPTSVAVPSGVDQNAFNALKGSAIISNAMDERKINSEISLQERLNSVLGARKQAEAKGAIEGQLEAYGLTPGATPTAGADKIPGSPLYESNKDSRDALINLRKEFNALDPVKNFAKASQAATAISGALKDLGRVSDQELVRYSIQMIEPGMAVREGEQNAVASSQSIPEEWKGQIDAALSGGTTLRTDVREGIKRLASRAYDSHKRLYDQAFDLYGKEATMQGFDPSRLSYIGEAPDSASVFGEIAEAAPQYSADELRAAGYSDSDIAALSAQGRVK